MVFNAIPVAIQIVVKIIATPIAIANQIVVTNVTPVAPPQQKPIASAIVDYSYQLPLELF